MARELDLTETAARHWYEQAEIDSGEGPARALTTAEREVLERLAVLLLHRMKCVADSR